MIATQLLAGPLLSPMGYGQTYDGTPYLPLALLIGILLGILAQRDAQRPATALAGGPAAPA